MKSVFPIRSSDHHFALFLTQFGTNSVDEETFWSSEVILHGMKEREIILLLIRYSIPVKNSFSEISPFAHHDARFLIQPGIWVSSWADEIGIPASMLDPINEMNKTGIIDERICKTFNELKSITSH